MPQKGSPKRARKKPSLLTHFLNIWIITFGVIYTSILLGAFLGAPLTTGGADLAMQVMVAAGVHVFIFYVAFNTVVFDAFATRMNPYVTLIDLLLNGTITPWVALTELAAQAVASVCASALFYALMENSTFTYVGTSGIAIGSEGWAFSAETLASLLMGWVIFSNRKYGASDRTRMAMAVAYVIGVSAAIVYPFIGLTTHSPFRWLANCVPSGTCGAPGSWVFPVAPLLGLPLGFALHKATDE